MLRNVGKRSGRKPNRLRSMRSCATIEARESQMPLTTFAWNNAAGWNVATNRTPNGIPGASDNASGSQTLAMSIKNTRRLRRFCSQRLNLLGRWRDDEVEAAACKREVVSRYGIARAD